MQGRKLGDMRWTISKKLNIGMFVVLLVLALSITYVTYLSIKNNLIKGAQDKLVSDLQLGYEYLDEKIPGDWRAENGILYKGNVKINDNFEIVDEIGKLTGGNTVTIFLGDTRIATNVLTPDGKRAVGTKVADEVKEVVLNQKKRYVGRANVVGNWYQTAYDPIFDQNGNVIGIWYTGVPEGPYLQRAKYAALNNAVLIGIIGILVFIVSFFFLRNQIRVPLSLLTTGAEKIARFELDGKSFRPKGTDEIAQLGQAFHQMKANLLDLVGQINESAQQLAEASNKLTIHSKETEKSSEQVAESVQAIAEGLTKQSVFVHQIVDLTSQAVQAMEEGLQQAADTLAIAQESTQKAREGDQAIQTAVQHLTEITEMVSGAVQSINKLGERSKEIGSIITTITSVAQQTNLLALNAAIEASRAGEAGRGFAVVADEVRKLAEESGQSAKQITDLIQSIQADTAKAVEVMETSFQSVLEQVQLIEKSREALTMIVQKAEQAESNTHRLNQLFNDLMRKMENIQEKMMEIASVTEQSSASAQEVSASTEEQAAAVTEISNHVESLDRLFDRLKKQIDRFKC